MVSLTLLETVFSVFDHLWTHDSLIVPLTVGGKTKPYIDQGRSKLNVLSLFKTKFGYIYIYIYITKLEVSRRFQPAIYTAFHEEYESEVQNTKILQGNLKTSISSFHFFYCLTR